jgi:hypothetical protein
MTVSVPIITCYFSKGDTMTIAKTINAISTLLLFLLLIANIADAENKCNSIIAVRNSSGGHGFGIMTNHFADGEPVTIRPSSLAVDSKDNIYVGDSVNYRVVKFDGAGKFLSEIKLQPPVKVIKPEITGHIINNVALDKDDNLYVWNHFENRVEIYDQNGKFKEFINPADDKQKGVFTKIPKGKFSKYMYEFDSYVPDKKLPGWILHSITVSDVSGKDKKVISKCNGVEFDYDEDGDIYSFDYNGNIYTFDHSYNVIKINPFK